MKIKYLFSLMLLLAISVSAIAQNNAGVDYFKLGELKLAKETLKKELNSAPAVSNYYLGEIAFREGNMTEAQSYYEKGLAAEPDNALNQIGLAKLNLKTNTKDADKTLSNIVKKNKKNVAVIIEVAQAYLDNGMKEQALVKLQDARKADKKSPWIYVFEGDMHAKDKKAGDAAAQYDQAKNFDPDCAIAYIKNAQVYSGINPQESVKGFKDAIRIRPSYTIVNKYLADLYYSRGLYKDAIEGYSKYIAAGDYTLEDMTRYAASEYFSKNTQEAKKIIEQGLAIEPNNFVLTRLKMYTEDEEKDYVAGAATAQKFFSIVRTHVDTSTFIVQDYTTYANILKEQGQIDEALVQYAKAIELDQTKISLYQEISTTLAEEKRYLDAAKVYSKYLEMAGDDKVDATDYFQLGRYYYFAGADANKSTDEAVKATAEGILKQADATFAIVAERKLDSHLGPWWRGRTNSLLDPDSKLALARPHYESVVAILTEKGEPDETGALVEACTYLAYSSYLQWDAASRITKKPAEAKEAKEQMKLYTDKLLELEPTNSMGLQFKEVLNK